MSVRRKGKWNTPDELRGGRRKRRKKEEGREELPRSAGRERERERKENWRE